MASVENTLNVLNHLIEVCIDGEKGYRGAAAEIENSHHENLFRAYARERAKYASVLDAEVRRLGGEAYHTGTGARSLHRGWMRLRSILNREHDYLIVRECRRGENIASMNYREALEEELPPHLKSILARQLLGILDTRNRLNGLVSSRKESKMQ